MNNINDVGICKTQCVPVFQLDCVAKKQDLEKIKDDIREQIKDGIVVIDARIKFLGVAPQSL